MSKNKEYETTIIVFIIFTIKSTLTTTCVKVKIKKYDCLKYRFK